MLFPWNNRFPLRKDFFIRNLPGTFNFPTLINFGAPRTFAKINFLRRPIEKHSEDTSNCQRSILRAVFPLPTIKTKVANASELENQDPSRSEFFVRSYTYAIAIIRAC